MFEKPNYHNTPNEFVDTYLKDLSGAETKIINVVFRKTFGFHKDFDYISIGQFMDYTGLSNRQVIDSTKSLIEKDMICLKYQCPKCDTEFPSIEKDFICPTCRTHEKPNKLFSISINGKSREVMQKFPKVVKKVHRGSEKISKGSEKSSQGGSEKSSHTKERSVQKETITKISSLGPQDLIVPGNEIETEKNDDDIVAIAEKIADKKIELTEQIVSIQKKLIARYSLQEWDKKPSYQFIKELLKINESYGGFEYVMKKIDQMPIPLETKEIGQVLRSWCQRPEKGDNTNIQKPQKSHFQIETENSIEKCRRDIESCKSVGDGFWEILSLRMTLEKESDFKTERGTARDLWHGYERERLRLDPDKTLEWFMETFMDWTDPDSWD
jgi:hypothetical protein